MAQLDRRYRGIAGPTLANGLPTFQGLGAPVLGAPAAEPFQETWVEKRDREALTNPPAPFQETWIEKRDRERAAGIADLPAGSAPGLANGGAVYDPRRTQSDFIVTPVAPVGPSVKEVGVNPRVTQIEANAAQGGHRNEDGSWSAEAPARKADPAAPDFRRRLGLANGGGIAGLIPGKVDPKVADDVNITTPSGANINAKIGEYIIPQEVVAAIGKDKFDQLVLEVKKSLGLPAEIGPKRHDQPDSMGRMDKSKMKGIADVPGLAAGGGVFYGDELGNLTRSKPMTLVENYGMPRNVPAGQIPYTGSGQPVGSPSGLSRPAIPSGAPTATEVPLNPRNLPTVRPSSTPALKGIAGELAPNASRGFTMGAEGATVSPARPVKQVLQLAHNAAEPLEQITSDQVKTNLGRARSALTKGAQYVTPEAAKTVGRGVLRGIAGGVATDMLLPAKANAFDDVTAIKKFTEKKQAIAGVPRQQATSTVMVPQDLSRMSDGSLPVPRKPAGIATPPSSPPPATAPATRGSGSIVLGRRGGTGTTRAPGTRLGIADLPSGGFGMDEGLRRQEEATVAGREAFASQVAQGQAQAVTDKNTQDRIALLNQIITANQGNQFDGREKIAGAQNELASITGQQVLQQREAETAAGLEASRSRDASHLEGAGITAGAHVRAAEIGAEGREAAAKALQANHVQEQQQKQDADWQKQRADMTKQILSSYDFSGISPTAANEYAGLLADTHGKGYVTIKDPSGTYGDILVHQGIEGALRDVYGKIRTPDQFMEYLKHAGKLGGNRAPVYKTSLRNTAALPMIKSKQDPTLGAIANG